MIATFIKLLLLMCISVLIVAEERTRYYTARRGRMVKYYMCVCMFMKKGMNIEPEDGKTVQSYIFMIYDGKDRKKEPTGKKTVKINS